MPRIVLMLAFLVMVATAEEQAQARQMHWNGIKSIGKPANYLPEDGTSSMTAQAKSSSNYQSLPSQSLDGQGDLSRDGPYSGGDYAYEPSSDSAYGGLSSSGYGYDYQRYLPTTSKPFFSVSTSLRQPPAYPQYQQQQQQPTSGMTTIPNSFLRGVPRDQLDHPISSLSGMQSGRISTPYQQMGGYLNYYYNNSTGINSKNENQMADRAGYDEDIPLGGISSTSSGFAGTTMRNAIGTSRQDDFSYGTVNGGVGFGSLPPAPGLVGGGLGYSSFASPGYSSNYGTGSNYLSPAYGYPSTGYAGGLGNTGYSSYASDVSYRSPLYSNYANYGNYGGGYGYGYQPTTYYKKPKKAYLDWFKFNKQLAPYSSYGGYGGGGYGAAIPYDYYYDPPSLWLVTKFAMKSMFKSLFKPFFKWLPFCSPFVYYDRDDRAEDKVGTFVTALTAFLPIGLFLAAIVPNIITVSSGRRKRSEKEEAQIAQDEATFPILDMISSFGVRSLQEPSCQSKIVCEIGRMGGLPEANTVQRALWLTANYVPERFSRLLGMDKLFRQIRSQQCSEFMCSTD